ncbi:vascular endothelial growth factor A-A-like isoform X2 [Archocentrus centrarchus]|uniref:vascular endothelial growth factor A-A-like isoform X2 n=1 Tax=Archocentrus centrarchus TaxID=63155 RepID=UPI0011EA3CB9|nr:vascular endothelial growth factor A-A-like isoform X2 [Archocentrus centrarchus]
MIKTASLNKGTEESRRDVVSFREVITKSMCQPREVLVDIFQEYPEDTEHTYIPSSVVLNLCGGCCSDEAMECAPTQTRNITLQVMRFRHMLMQHTIHLSFTEHDRCDCRIKSHVQAKGE